MHLSTRPVGENATVGSDEAWEAATAALTEALDDVGLEYEVDEGEGAFYGKRRCRCRNLCDWFGSVQV